MDGGLITLKTSSIAGDNQAASEARFGGGLFMRSRLINCLANEFG